MLLRAARARRSSMMMGGQNLGAAVGAYGAQAHGTAPYARYVLQHTLCARQVQAAAIGVEVVRQFQAAVLVHAADRDARHAIMIARTKYRLADRMDIAVDDAYAGPAFGVIDEQVQLFHQRLIEI